MKLLFFSLTALSLLISILAHSIQVNPHGRKSLSGRGFLPEGTRPETRPNPDYKQPNEESQPKPIVVSGVTLSFQGIKSAIQNLPKQRWARQWSKGIATRVDAFKRLVNIRPGYRGNPEVLFETDDLGVPTLRPLELTSKEISRLREVEFSGGTRYVLEDKTWTIQKNPETGERGMFEYTEIYVSPDWAVSTILESMLARAGAKAPDVGANHAPQKRSDVLQQISGQSEQPDSPEDSTAVFQSYLGLLHSTQATLGTFIAPVLNNLTAGSNSTLVHQMALSIYYDLTGSTTILSGPFNYGMSFVGNSSNATSEVATGIKNIYASMWAQALVAANSSGLYAQQIYLAESLYTNDSSVLPAGFIDNTSGVDSTSTSS